MSKQKSLIETQMEKLACKRFLGMSYFFDPLIEKMWNFDVYFNYYIEAYLLANHRINRAFDSTSKFESSTFIDKTASVIFTTDKSFFQQILDENNMSWVKEEDLKHSFGFVAGEVYVHFENQDNFKRSLGPRSNMLDYGAHELTHLLIHQYFGLKRSELRKYWTAVFEEAFAVILNNQYGSVLNMRKDLEQNLHLKLERVTLKHLLKKGFKQIDTRFPHESFEYQYAATLAIMVNDSLPQNEGGNHYVGNIFKFLVGKKGILGRNIIDDIGNVGIDVFEIEKKLRLDIGF